MASYDLSCGLIDDKHIERYGDVITALEERMGVGAGALSVQTEAGELIANAREDGISVGINVPGGKCADIAFVDADPGANDLYPTPVRAFTYNGRDEEPDHRTDVHLDGDMVLEGQLTAETPAHLPVDVAGGCQGGRRQERQARCRRSRRHQALGGRHSHGRDLSAHRGLADAARPGRGERLPVVPVRVYRASERSGHPDQPSRRRKLRREVGIGFDGPGRFAAGGPDWSWMDMAMDFTVDLTFADDMELSDWISSGTVATGAAWARCFNSDCGPADTLGVKEITAALKRFESPSYLARGPIADIEDLPLGYYWCPDAVDSDPSYNGYLLNVFSRSGHGGFPCTAFELFGGVTLNDVPSFGFDDGWDGSCLNRLDWFEDAIGMDGDGVTAGLVTDDLDSIKSLTARCPSWVECFPSYSEKAAQGEDDILKAVKQFRVEAKRTKKAAVPDCVPLIQFLGARTAAAKTGGGNDSGNGLHI